MQVSSSWQTRPLVGFCSMLNFRGLFKVILNSSCYVIWFFKFTLFDFEYKKMADWVSGQKTGGQELVGGLDCTVHRNYFGSQVNCVRFVP